MILPTAGLHRTELGFLVPHIVNPPRSLPPCTDPPATTPPATTPPVTDPPATTPPVTDPPATTPPAGAVARPGSVLSTGFFVKDGKIYDPHGYPFMARGINHTHWWGDQPTNLAAIDELPKTNANIVRAVFGPDFGVDTPAEKREVVARYAANLMPVIVEDHRATCGTDPQQIVAVSDEWTDPAHVSWLNDYEKSVILNIANEWGPSDAGVWAGAYEASINRLRAAGVHNMILLDAGGGCGQDVTTVLAKAAEIEASDPEHNVAFSIHMYGFWRTSEATDTGSWGADGSPWSIRSELQTVVAQGIPVIAGEIGFEQDSQVGYRTHEALQTFAELGIGWIAWSWNQNSDATYDLRAGGGYTYNGASDLTAGGQAFLLGPYGIAATSVRSTTFDP